MENKINVAELLKNCPKDMELDCLMYEDVYFDYVDECNIIHCYIQHKTYKTSIEFSQYGTPNNNTKSKCVIFPKGKTTWEGFQRPFKDGDILSYQYEDFTNRTIYIYMQHSRMNTTYYVALSGNFDSDFMINDKEEYALNGYNDSVRLATEEEKEKLFKAIKNNGYQWNAETKTLEKLIEPKFKVGDRVQNKNTNMIGTINLIINDEREYQVALKNGGITYILFEFQDSWELVPNKFDITTLKPFDKVLVRCDNNGLWDPQFFAKYRPHSKFPFTCTYNSWSQCVPYEGNEHLLGTTDDCDEFYKNW